MPFANHRQTIQVAIALYAIVVIPGYGWHLVPGCGHDHCHQADESDGPHTHCDHHHHGGHCQHRAAKRAPADASQKPHQDGFHSDSPVTPLLACHGCGICQFFAQAQAQAVAFEDQRCCQLPEVPLAVVESLASVDVVASYSARAPPVRTICV